MSTALVTGSAGFVGRHMVRALEARGFDVVEIDIANGDPLYDCRRCFRRGSADATFDLVVHCAAVVGGRTLIDGEPLRLATEDLTIDAELFRWALRARPKRIVYFSSSAAYPTFLQHSGGIRLEERHIDHDRPMGAPDQTYGMVKLVGERLAAEANAEGIPTHVFRPFSGYGPGQDLVYPFPAFVHRAVVKQHPFQIWGDGQSQRDWVHIDDVVGAVMAAIDWDVFGPVNICTGRATSFDELAALCMTAAGWPAYSQVVDYVTDAPQGVQRRVGDPTLLHQFYEPKVTLEEGVKRAIREAT